MKQPFADIELIRQRARKRLDEGAVTGGYGADRARVLEVLDELLATSMQVSLRSRHYHYACYRPEPGLSDLFRELSDFEEGASGELAARMVQLRGTPDFRVESLALRSHVRFTPVSDPEEMVQEVLVAARVQIETQCAAVRWLAEDDPTTRRLIESLLAQVEAFAERLSREQSGITSEETEDSRIEGERERWSQAPDKPPWWDPQWIARS